MSEHIVSWSYSKLIDFEKCKLLAKIKHLDKTPEPERPLRPGQTEHANDRGIHKFLLVHIIHIHAIDMVQLRTDLACGSRVIELLGRRTTRNSGQGNG